MFLLQANYIISLIALVIILLITGLLEVAIKKSMIQHNIGRKILHITAILICAYVIHKTNFRITLSYIFLTAFIFLLVAVKKKWLSVQVNNSYGIALFPLAFFILLQIEILSTKTIVFSVCMLALADAFASIIGHNFGKHPIVFLHEPKTWIGSLTFFLTAIMITIAFYSNEEKVIAFYLLVSIVATASELYSFKGSDNLSIPIVTAIWVHILLQFSNHSQLQLVLQFLYLLLAALLACYKKWLTISGALAALVLGLFLISAGSIKYLVTPIVFFIVGSLLSAYTNKKSVKIGRDAKQVFANGLVGVICLMIFILSNKDVYLYAFIVSFSVSMADTVSSEIGNYCKGKTFDIISFKPTNKGLSGGISWQGTLAALLASFGIASVTHFYIPLIPIIFLQIIFFAFTGMLVDSILGSQLQVKYNVNKVITEQYQPSATIVKGYAWCDNNMVNFCSNIITTVIFIFFNS
ncbi:MAG: DUF92 domain-containing protein [Chitinophagaceae bacterium]